MSVAKEEGISYGTAHHVTIILNLYPHRVHMVHKLKPLNYDRRIVCCEWFLNFVAEDVHRVHNWDCAQKVHYLSEKHLY